MTALAEERTLERLGLVGLISVTAVAWWLQFEPFSLPNNDYATFEATARAFAAGELPARFQRMPILPALMALLAPLCPEPHPYLTAALLLNWVFSLGLLVALYDLAERLLGRGALLVPTLFAASNQFHSMGLQPLVEPSLGFFVVSAFALCARRSPWQYVAAGAAALSRYEAALLLGVLALVNALADRDARRHFGWAALAGLPFCVWFGLGTTRGSGASWYLELMEGKGFALAPHFFVTSIKEPLRGWLGSGWRGTLGFALGAALPIAIGLRVLVRTAPREAAGFVLLWILATTTVVFFGIDKGRYAYAYQWIPLFLLSAGLLQLFRTETARAHRTASARRPVDPHSDRRRRSDRDAPAVHSAPRRGAPRRRLGGRRALGLRRARGHRPRALGSRASRNLVPAPGRGRRRSRRGARDGPDRRRGHAGEAQGAVQDPLGQLRIVLASEWLGANAGPDDRFVVLHKKHYLHRSGLAAERFVTLANLEATSVAEVASEMERRGLTHLIVTWRKPPKQADDEHAERKYKWFLIEPLLRGEAAPGLRRIASLSLPEHMERPPVRIYRADAGGDGHDESPMKPAFAPREGDG